MSSDVLKCPLVSVFLGVLCYNREAAAERPELLRRRAHAIITILSHQPGPLCVPGLYASMGAGPLPYNENKARSGIYVGCAVRACGWLTPADARTLSRGAACLTRARGPGRPRACGDDRKRSSQAGRARMQRRCNTRRQERMYCVYSYGYKTHARGLFLFFSSFFPPALEK